MVLTLNGVDIRRYLAPKGFEWNRVDREGSNGGPTMSGEELRDRLAIKRTLNIKCRALNTQEASVVLKAIEPEYINVQHTDPAEGGTVTRIMYVRNAEAPYLVEQPKGGDWWEGVSFQLIER